MATIARTIRRGMTLIELLIVITILLILVTAATTMMNVASQGAEVREAARQLNAMFAGCIARTAETNRPFGLWIDRTPGTPTMAREIFYAQSPPLYSGDFLTSSATIVPASVTVNCTQVTDFTANNFLRPGDFIRFNYAGPWFPIATIVDADSLTYTVGDRPAPLALTNIPFQLRRGPRKSLANPLQMPSDTIIDLSQSGAGISGVEFATGTDPVRIMFNPNGNIDRVYYDNPAGTAVTQPVIGKLHLLVGRLENLGANNLADQACRWVSVSQQTGTVITTENMGGALSAARVYAISGKGMGGN